MSQTTTPPSLPEVTMDPIRDAESGPFDSLVADAAQVTLRLAQVPGRQLVQIPSRAVAMVAGLGAYGD